MCCGTVIANESESRRMASLRLIGSISVCHSCACKLSEGKANDLYQIMAYIALGNNGILERAIEKNLDDKSGNGKSL